jgi:hypothetical protein
MNPSHQHHPAYFQPLFLLAAVTAPTTPSVLLQAVVTLGEKTAEGRLIEGVALAWSRSSG